MKLSAKLATGAAGILCGAAVIAAPTAQADADSAFTSVLTQQGITWPSEMTSNVIAMGHGVCVDWAQGANFQAVYNDVKGTLTNLSDSSVGVFIGAATAAYCPQYSNKIQ
jgi:hypothetical protein